MKQLLIALLVLGYFGFGVQAAEEVEQRYAGFFYGEVDTNEGDVENMNLGLVIGGRMESGPGIEFFYSDTVDKDEFSEDGFSDVRYSTQAWGLLGTYKFGTKFYGVVKGGYTFVDLKADIAGRSNESLDEDGLSYGVGAGFEVGKNGAIELNYLVLPEMEESLFDENVEFENELTSIGYNWHF